MPKIVIYTTKFCGFCHGAKRFLNQKNLPFTEIPLDGKPDERRQLTEQLGGYSTVPMIFINDEFIGGYTELVRYPIEDLT